MVSTIRMRYPLLIEPTSKDAADLVIGFRSLGQMPFHRRVGRVVLDHVTGAGGGVVTDSQCGFRALNRKAIELLAGKLKKYDFSIESEMTRTAHEQRLRLVKVPIHSKYGNFKTSTKNPVSHGVGVLDSVIGLIAEEAAAALYRFAWVRHICYWCLLWDIAASGV